MLPRWLATVLMLFLEAWSARRDAQIKLLMLQVELLRAKLPGDRVILAPEDRARLLQVGKQMNHQVHDVMGIVSVKTYRRWVREQEAGKQPGRNVTMWTEDEGLDLRFLIRDRDSKYTEAFDEHFRRISGEQIVKTPFQSPAANSFAESWIGSLKRECLNALWCFSLKQVDYIVQTRAGQTHFGISAQEARATNFV